MASAKCSGGTILLTMWRSAKGVSHLLLAIGQASILTACVSYRPGIGFDELGQDVAKRSGSDFQSIAGRASAEETQTTVGRLLQAPLTADSAVQVALLNNPNVQAILETLNIAQAEMVLAGLVTNPFVTGDAKFGGEKAALEFSVGQMVLDLLYLPRRQRIGQIDFDAAKVTAAAAVLDFVWEVRKALLDLQAAEETHDLRKQVLAAIDASFALARKLYSAGKITGLALANEEVLYEEERLALATAELTVSEKRESLSVLMGLTHQRAVTWRTASHLPRMPDAEPSLDELERTAIERNLELERLRFELRAIAEKAKLAAPLTVFSTAEVGAASERDADGTWASGPSISISIPVFNQGQAAKGKVDAELHRGQARYSAAEISLLAEIRLAKARLTTARERAQRESRVILPLRKTILKQAEQQYVVMLVSGFELFKARRDEIDARVAQIASILGYWKARADYELLLNGGKAALLTKPSM